jgi:hypothetical protein
MPKSGEDYFVFIISNEPIEEALYNATTYAFDEPGDPPVFREVKKKPRLPIEPDRINTQPASTRMPPPELEREVTVTSANAPVPPQPCDYFMMPDGLRYNRSDLEKNWHMMSNRQVFVGNFRECRR